MTGFPTLETPRLRLREIVPADAAALFAVHGDPEAMRWFGTDPVPDLASSVKLVEVFAGWRTQPNPGTRWGFVREGLLRQAGHWGGQYHDMLQYGLLRQDWQHPA